ncbi:hypothetical protein ElyMa_001460200 [Elysia marginata]|uniref:Uncharacterized protein n=1 Tax=Elysia marginata TaxID=1093978 RepID=A0AAV4IZP8_9GAST|nr:hypothetical protein ElyMa_001460200 [Elysia marginata]
MYLEFLGPASDVLMEDLRMKVFSQGRIRFTDHIQSEFTEGPHCIDQDLRDCTDAAQAWTTQWRDKIYDDDGAF